MGEGIEVIHYQDGQKYESHHDYFAQTPPGETSISNRDDRVATVLMYLEAPERGGETIFPWAKTGEPINPQQGWVAKPHDYKTECKELQDGRPLSEGIAVPVKQGAAVLFYSYRPD